MKIISVSAAVFAIGTCLAAAATAAPAQTANAETKQRSISKIGVISYREKPITAKLWAPVERQLERSIPEVDFEIIPLNMPEIEQAVLKGELDFVITQPAHYIAMSATHPLSSPLATAINNETGNNPSSMFGGVIFARADSGIRSLRDLKGKTIAAVGTSSFGGYLVQAYELEKAGVELPQDAEVLLTKAPQDLPVFAVLSGKAQAGFVRTGLLESLASEGKIDLSQIRIINAQANPRFPQRLSTPLYPEFPFVAPRGADESLSRRVTAALLLFNENQDFSAPGISGFAAPADYAPVANLLRDMRLPPFDRSPDFTAKDVWGQYRTEILSIGLVTALALFFAGLLAANRGKLLAERDRAQHRLRALQESESRIRALVSTIPDMFWMKDPQGRYLHVSRTFGAFLRKDESDIIGRADSEVLPESIAADWTRADQAALESSKPTPCERVFQAPDGSIRTFASIRTPVLLDGETLGVMGLARDITSEREQDKSLRLAAKIFDSAQEAIMVTDAERTIVQVNQAFERLTGYSMSETLGKKASMLRSERHGQAFYATLWDSIRADGHWSGEMWNRRKDGSEFPSLKTISALKGPDGVITHYVSIFSDITSMKAHEAQLEHVANYDPLTGLPNRRLLDDRLRMAIARAEREHSMLAVCCMDIDGFKAVNDELGHAAGDQLLREISHRIEAACRETDTVARLGGDEFAILIGSMPNRSEANAALERILEAIRQPIPLPGGSRSISGSIGSTFYPFDPSDDGDTLIRHADIAMYQAKSSGKNRVRIFDAESEKKDQSIAETLKRLEQALLSDEFVLHYQPKVRLADGRISGAEALIRWEHPERGLIPPLEFLPILQGSDLNIQVGEWVIERALTQASEWRAQGVEFSSISVNIDAEHLLSESFVERLAQALGRHPDVKPSMLEIEILETAALNDMGRANAAIAECLRLGISFALDDFGTGYSSIDYFRRLPVGCLKIDRSFVRDMLDDPEDLSIVKSVIGLARAFSRPVVAEGVETIAHAALLFSMGCEIAQGYGIARPMPADRFAEWTSRWDPAKGAASFGAAQHSCCSDRGKKDTGLGSDPLAPVSVSALSAAAASHTAWVADFENFVLGLSSQPPQMDHLRCALGRWLQGPALAETAHAKNILTLSDQHELAHRIAIEIMELVYAGKGAEAKARFPELLAERDKLLAMIHSLIAEA